MNIVPRPWTDLRRFTPARVGLGRVGNAQPTTAHLSFQADHAAARDAVMASLDVPALQAALGRPSVLARSEAADRQAYLLRPDQGRRLHPDVEIVPQPGCLAVVIADGLSAIAAQLHAPALIAAMDLAADTPIVIATQARVALGDDIGAALQAAAVLVMIGERPGLSSADSLGAYLTWRPVRGCSDAERNCVSNIRPGGLPIADAARKLHWLMAQMQARRLTGVALKDEEALIPISYERSISVVRT